MSSAQISDSDAILNSAAYRLDDGAIHRSAGGGVKFSRNSASSISLPPGNAGLSHGAGHQQWIAGAGDGGVQQDTVAAKFHSKGDIAGSANTGINDDRIVGVAIFEVFHTDANVVGIQNPLSAADWTAGRHY